MLSTKMRIIDLLERYPEAKEVLVAHGMGCCDCMGASLETLENGAHMHGIDLSKLMEELDKKLGHKE